jgi:hypothetical protein
VLKGLFAGVIVRVSYTETLPTLPQNAICDEGILTLDLVVPLVRCSLLTIPV